MQPEDKITRALSQTITFVGTEAQPAWEVLTEVTRGGKLCVRLREWALRAEDVEVMRRNHLSSILGIKHEVVDRSTVTHAVLVGVGMGAALATLILVFRVVSALSS